MTITVAATNPTGSGVHPIDAPDLRAVLGNELLRLAAAEEALAAEEASRVAYWEPCPDRVAGRREAARVLRDGAARMFATEVPR